MRLTFISKCHAALRPGSGPSLSKPSHFEEEDRHEGRVIERGAAIADASLRRRSRNGFSLLELMVVLVLIAIMTALIIPEMKGTYEEAVLRSTGRQILSALKLAHSQSITLQQPHRLRLDQDGGRYVVERAARDAEGPGFLPVQEFSGASGRLDPRISIEVRRPDAQGAVETLEELAPDLEGGFDLPERTSTVSFYPSGMADAAEIRLRDRQGFGIALQINPTTARVKIVEWVPDE
jgi:type II secretion system protein H